MFSGCILQSRQCLNCMAKTLLSPAILRNFSSSKSILYAQPSSNTHTHLLKLGEVTPGISSDIYRERRRRLMEEIIKSSTSRSESDTAHLVVIPSASVLYMTQNIPYRFRQSSDFSYLSGFKEPDSALVIYASSKKFPEHKSTLFVPKQTPYAERWEGKKLDSSATTSFLHVDETLYTHEFDSFLYTFAKSHQHFVIWYDYLNVSAFSIHQTMRDFMVTKTGEVSVESPISLLHQLRLIKCDAEIKLMRNTCQIAAQALKEVMKYSHYSKMEAHLEAKMDFECRIRGADYLSFPPVVAGGDRANTIHYIENNQIIHSNVLVLMDAGCECYGYSSDLARTWPVSGKFTDPQKELYQVVLTVQEELVELSKSNISLDRLFKIMCRKLGKGLQELNIIPKTFTEVEASEAAFTFCPHHVSHYLGMDVHDTSTVSRGILLNPGMVITIEPGVYISKDNTDVPEEFRGLCIRIEDDVLITQDGCEILTKDCPKDINKIEDLFKDL